MTRTFKCIKCTCTEIVIMHCEATYEGHYSKPERLGCKCLKCGYTWTEEPSDELDEKPKKLSPDEAVEALKKGEKITTEAMQKSDYIHIANSLDEVRNFLNL